MADQRLTQLSTATTLANSDLFYVVQNVTGTDGSSAKITFQDLNSQITPGGGSAWVLAGSNTSISGVNHVDFTGLSAYSEIYIFVKGITFGSADVATFRVSSDNGGTFYSASGDYVNIGTGTGIESNTTLSAGFYAPTATTARTAAADIQAFNLAQFHPVSYPVRTEAAGTPFSYINQAVAMNAVRVLSAAANNFTGGAIYIFGR